MHTIIKHYTEVRRQTIANFIIDRPIFGFCSVAERRRGSVPRQFWWDQEIDLDTARAASAADVAVGEELDSAA